MIKSFSFTWHSIPASSLSLPKSIATKEIVGLKDAADSFLLVGGNLSCIFRLVEIFLERECNWLLIVRYLSKYILPTGTFVKFSSISFIKGCDGGCITVLAVP